MTGLEAEFHRAVGEQANRMVELARAMHPEFMQDCITDPDRLAEHWHDDVRIRFVESLVDSELRHDNYVFYENDEGNGSFNDLLGLFSPAFGRRRIHRIQVQYRNIDRKDDRARVLRGRTRYPMRRYFTILHELGHYLQQTDDELAERLMSISSINYNKCFEEGACNKFASLSLLPDEYMREHCRTLRRFTAKNVADFFKSDQRRGTHKICRVSRQAVTRRFADFLPESGYTALARTEPEGAPRILFRTHGNGATQHDLCCTPEELELIRASAHAPSEMCTADGVMTVSALQTGKGGVGWNVLVYRPR